MPPIESDKKVEDSIRDGYTEIKSIGNVSKVEQAYDSAVKTGSHLPDSGPFAFVKTFYDQNQDAIKATATGLASLTSEGVSIESAVNRFTETAKVMLKGLDALAQVHPAIGVVVIAFKLVVTFDMTRRENNKKVLALKIEMQDMMSVLFELRHIRDPMEKGPDGSPLGDRMQKLMGKIAKDIKDAASICDAYLKKSFLARTLKSKIYEGRLADYGSKFEGNKDDIQRCLAMHTARGVDLANEKLDAQGLKIDQMTTKFDQVLQIFSQLDSPEELEVHKFIEEHGGVQTCIEDQELLSKLLAKSGQNPLGSTVGSDLGNARNLLLKEFHEDVDKMLEGHSLIFRGKLDIQSQQLDTIQAILTSGSHDKIINPVLKMIWKEMGWKGSVKARHLVLALHDHFHDDSFLSEHEASPKALTQESKESLEDTVSRSNDQWALSYVSPVHVQSIIEAIDDDGTGFVSIKEVNMFVTSPLRDWTLLQRLAYWAAGWHISISRYKIDMCNLVQKMFMLRDHLLPCNRLLVEGYLSDIPLLRIEHILRSTKLNRTTLDKHKPDLYKLVDIFDKTEEERLRKNLALVGDDLDSEETIALVTGPGRIERYLFPLLSILLKRHLRVIMLACRFVLHDMELINAMNDVRLIFKIVDERVGRIAGIFEHMHADVSSRLKTFAFGMFQLYYDKLYGRQGYELLESENTLPKWLDGLSKFSFRQTTSLQDEINAVPVEELKLGIFHLDVPPILDHPHTLSDSDMTNEPTPLGPWSGHFWDVLRDGTLKSGRGSIVVIIDDVSDGTITGRGQSGEETLKLKGTIDVSNNLNFTARYNSGFTKECEGIFDPERQTIKASCHAQHRRDQKFTLTLWRTPNHLFKFRSELTGTDSGKSLARARWAFVREAILYEVRRKSWSWNHFKLTIGDLKTFVDLDSRYIRGIGKGYPDRMLNPEEKAEVERLRRDLPTEVSNTCTALVNFYRRRVLVDHDADCLFCQYPIFEARLICLACVKKTDDLSRAMNICMSCLEASIVHPKITHNSSHSMIKFVEAVSNVDQVWSSRTVVKRVKATLRNALASRPDEGNERDQDAMIRSRSSSPISCVTCSKVVTIPCWVCRVCSKDTFRCLECEEKRIPPPDNHPHKLDHPVIRIGSLDPDPSLIPSDDDFNAKEKFGDLETRIDKMESRVQERFTKIEDKLASIEGLLRQVLEKTSPQVPS